MGLAVLLAVASKATCALAAGIVISVQSSDGKALPGAVITVHALSATARPSAPVRAVMDQIDRTFQPDLLVIPVRSTVEFPNSDSVSHQIYSFSPAKKFQLPLYRGKPYPPVQFDQVGVVTLGCNIHDSMLAYVVVTDASYFGRTDSSGSWSTDVPRGTYRVNVWHPRIRESTELEREMTVADSDRMVLTLQLSKPLQPAPLQGAGHTWDSY
jgi:plastocyanin